VLCSRSTWAVPGGHGRHCRLANKLSTKYVPAPHVGWLRQTMPPCSAWYVFCRHTLHDGSAGRPYRVELDDVEVAMQIDTNCSVHAPLTSLENEMHSLSKEHCTAHSSAVIDENLSNKQPTRPQSVRWFTDSDLSQKRCAPFAKLFRQPLHPCACSIAPYSGWSKAVPGGHEISVEHLFLRCAFSTWNDPAGHSRHFRSSIDESEKKVSRTHVGC
jgi:hypothetical protein